MVCCFIILWKIFCAFISENYNNSCKPCLFLIFFLQIVWFDKSIFCRMFLPSVFLWLFAELGFHWLCYFSLWISEFQIWFSDAFVLILTHVCDAIFYSGTSSKVLQMFEFCAIFCLLLSFHPMQVVFIYQSEQLTILMMCMILLLFLFLRKY